MQGQASVKVPDGKLVRVEAEYTDTVDDVTITGDFFLEPPQALEALEEALEGHETSASEEELLQSLQDVDAELIGFAREDIVTALQEVVGSGSG